MNEEDAFIYAKRLEAIAYCRELVQSLLVSNDQTEILAFTRVLVVKIAELSKEIGGSNNESGKQ